MPSHQANVSGPRDGHHLANTRTLLTDGPYAATPQLPLATEEKRR